MIKDFKTVSVRFKQFLLVKPNSNTAEQRLDLSSTYTTTYETCASFPIMTALFTFSNQFTDFKTSQSHVILYVKSISLFGFSSGEFNTWN